MRTPNRTTIVRALGMIAVSTAIALTGATVAIAAPLPNKFLLSSHFGREVDKTTGANICTVASKEECQFGRESSEAGGFLYPRSVAVNNDSFSPSHEHVYVADSANHRVQEFTASGQFVSMFGMEVNKKGGNVCAKVEESECQAGVEGGAPGQFGEVVSSIAVDAASGDVYVADRLLGSVNEETEIAQRVQAFTAAGQFLFEIGKEVNKTTKANVCAAGEACGPAALQTFAAAEANSGAGAFDFETESGNLLAVGGPKDLLYVGDHARVQEFNATSGAPVGQVSLTGVSASGKATGVAVDPAGDLFVSDSEAPGVHEYDPSGVLQSQVIDGASSGILGIALDPYGRVGIIEEGATQHGVLYSATGVKISEFAPPSGEMPAFSEKALAFAASDEAYVAETTTQEVEAYMPVVFPEARTCAPGEVTGTSARLCGEINPDGVRASGFFQYGKSSSLGSLTPVAFEGEGEAFSPVPFALTGLEPNQDYRYRIAVEAQAGGETLQGHGEEMAFHTQVVAPQIPGQPSASFVKAQSVVLNALVNPEHTTTRYHYEYGACPALAGCATLQSTPDKVSSVYGAIASTRELVGLAPATTYSYRLVANNEFEEAGKTLGGKATGAEATFTTGPAPVPRAETGAYSALTPTSAIIAGMVNPDGLPASYTFELGVYNGASTQYGVLVSGPAGTSTVPVEETSALTGLQPGTTYAYRITVSSGYIGNESHTAQGAALTFTTPGLPSVLALPPVLAQLPVPNTVFPKALKPSKKKKVKAKRKRHKKPKALKSKKTHKNFTHHTKKR